MFEDSQIETVPFYGEAIGCHSTGYQAAQIRAIPCNEILQRFEAAEFIFIEVGSISIRLGKVAGRTKIRAQSLLFNFYDDVVDQVDDF